MSIPTVFGMELSDGVDLGLEAIPQCCDDDMTGEDTDSGGRTYTCQDCGTELTVTASGTVLEIVE